MQTLSTTGTAGLLFVVVMVTAGCGTPGPGSVESPTETTPVANASISTSTTSRTVAAIAPGGEQVELTGPEDTPQVSSSTTTPSLPAAPELSVDDIDSMIDGLDETLAELDQLLNQATAALAAEEGEIIP